MTAEEQDFAAEFMRGQIDCKAGKPHKPNQPSAYDRGYRTQYENEQVQEWLTRGEFARGH